MNRGDCRVCEKPLLDQPGPVLMDREGHSYHFLCWRDMLDKRIQEQRERIAEQKPTIEARKKRIKEIQDQLDSYWPPA
jgi:hypothetical protein